MAANIHLRTGCPRLKRKPEDEPEIPVGMIHNRYDGQKFFIHTCGCKVVLGGYGDATVIRCPQCHTRIPIGLPQCKICGARCADLDAKIIHEKFCNGEYQLPDPTSLPPTNRSHTHKSESHYTSERMKVLWQDSAYWERVAAGHARKKKESQLSDSVGAAS